MRNVQYAVCALYFLLIYNMFDYLNRLKNNTLIQMVYETPRTREK